MPIIFLYGLGRPRRGMEHKLHQSSAWHQDQRVYCVSGIHPTLMASQVHYWIQYPPVSGTAKSTELPVRSTTTTGPTTSTTETLQPSTQQTWQTLTSWWAASPAKLSRWLGDEKDSAIDEVSSSLKSLGLLGKSNHAFYCLRTSKVCYLTTRGKHSLPSLLRWMIWGMTSSGKCLTAKISVFPKTGSECTLWEIIETNPDRKYFLSDKQKPLYHSSRTVEKGIYAATLTARQFASWNGNYIKVNSCGEQTISHVTAQPFVQLTETRTEEAKRIRKESMKQGKDWSPRRSNKTGSSNGWIRLIP